MARKRKKLAELNYGSKEYWNRLLAQDGLSLSQGLDPRLVYAGSASELEAIEGAQHTSGRKLPKKQDE